MTAKMEVFVPKQLFDTKALERIINNELNETAAAVKVDFLLTIKTWTHKPAFVIKRLRYAREVSTDDEIYGFVNFGTKAHPITPKKAGGMLRFQPAFVAKTVPRVVKSTPGGASGPYVVAKAVKHPGTEARDFDIEIAEKWEAERPAQLQRAIDAEIA